METKMFEVRDRATCIIVICTKLAPKNERERRMLRRCGWSLDDCEILLSRADDGRGSTDPYSHSQARTLREAHLFIRRYWPGVESGDIIDVEYILGETDRPKETDCAS